MGMRAGAEKVRAQGGDGRPDISALERHYTYVGLEGMEMEMRPDMCFERHRPAAGAGARSRPLSDPFLRRGPLKMRAQASPTQGPEVGKDY